jgi:hypothetical protein
MEPIKATLSKQRIGAILERIQAGEPLEPEHVSWSLIDCVTVAGVLLASAMTTGSYARSGTPGRREGAQKMLEHLKDSIEFVGAMASAHRTGTWDEFFEPTVTIGIRADGGVTPLEGFKR